MFQSAQAAMIKPHSQAASTPECISIAHSSGGRESHHKGLANLKLVRTPFPDDRQQSPHWVLIWPFLGAAYRERSLSSLLVGPQSSWIRIPPF